MLQYHGVVFTFSSLRNSHRWLAIIFSIPLLFIFLTGVLISISPKVSYLQPQVKNYSGSELSIGYPQILQIARSIPEAEVNSWNDITQLDTRPRQGIIRIRTKNYWEIQISGNTGEILSSAKRWKTFLIAAHEGALFGDWAHYGIFFPSGIAAVLLTATGIFLIAIPYFKRKKRYERI